MRNLPVKRKPAEVATPALLETEETPQKMMPCVICGSETQTGSPESMCWVCRRLKISAWRDVEQQMPAQE